MKSKINNQPWLSGFRCQQCSAAVSCSPIGPVLGGFKMGDWLTGKLDHAWVVHDKYAD